MSSELEGVEFAVYAQQVDGSGRSTCWAIKANAEAGRKDIAWRPDDQPYWRFAELSVDRETALADAEARGFQCVAASAELIPDGSWRELGTTSVAEVGFLYYFGQCTRKDFLHLRSVFAVEGMAAKVFGDQAQIQRDGVTLVTFDLFNDGSVRGSISPRTAVQVVALIATARHLCLTVTHDDIEVDLNAIHQGLPYLAFEDYADAESVAAALDLIVPRISWETVAAGAPVPAWL